MADLSRVEAVRAALRALDIQNFVLAIHDASFPAGPDDLGRGTPYSTEAQKLYALAASLGFNGIQLGPQGQTSDINASPYDGTLYARNVMNLPLTSLVEQGLLSEDAAAAFVRSRPAGASQSAAYPHAFRVYERVLAQAYDHFLTQRASPEGAELERPLGDFSREHAAWLEPASLYGPLSRYHRVGDWRGWGGSLDAHLDQRLWCAKPEEAARAKARLEEVSREYAQEREAFAFAQMLVHAEHDQLRERTRALGLKLFGDLQVGFSPVDAWASRGVILGSYRMGAPPSRTNREGQPWGYPVLDPAQYVDRDGQPGPALRVVERRMQKMLHEYDGVRLDHPHGLVCPWVYRTDDPDPFHAVQTGARLFESPNVEGHPELSTYAIARADQLQPSVPRYADDWLTGLDEKQVDRFSAQFDIVLKAAKDNGRAVTDLVCEVLSTQPYPLRRVLERHGLGRFRVTQKADLTRSEDVYRSENAKPQDWIMVGTHDTPPVWRLVPEWRAAGTHLAQATYLAERLGHTGAAREAFAKELASDDGLLTHAKFADIFASPARNVMIFFADLFGQSDIYNAPGTVNAQNWMLRVPPDWATAYPRAAKERRALNLPLALQWALKARGYGRSADEKHLLQALERHAQKP